MTPARTDPRLGAPVDRRIAAPNAVDVTWRAAALWATWMKSHCGITDALRETVDDLRVQKYLTVYEERYLQVPRRIAEADAAYRCRMLRIRTLFWAVGLISGLDPPSTGADAELRAIVEGRSGEDLVYEARLRPMQVIVAEANDRDLDSHLSGLDRNYMPRFAETTPEVIEPCIAFAWLFGRFSAGDSPEPLGIR